MDIVNSKKTDAVNNPKLLTQPRALPVIRNILTGNGRPVILHELGADTSFIQGRLRWRSKTFHLHRYHTANIAHQDSSAMFSMPANTMPAPDLTPEPL